MRIGRLIAFVAAVLLGLAGLGQPVLADVVAPQNECCSVAPSGTLNSSSSLSGVERASPEFIKAVSQRRTVHIAAQGSDELRYLDSIGAGANVGGANLDHILLRSNPSKAAVLEEFLHGTQQRLGLVERLGVPGAERHVKDFMIRHQRMLGLGSEDVRRLQVLMEAGL